MSSDFFASLSAIGNQVAVQSQSTASSSTSRSGSDAFAQLFAQNQIDADRRRDDETQRPSPPVAPSVLATPYDIARIDQPAPRADELPVDADRYDAPPARAEDREPPVNARTDTSRIHPEHGQARAEAVHARNAERRAARSEQADKKAAETDGGSATKAADGDADATKATADKSGDKKTLSDKTGDAENADGDTAKSTADASLADAAKTILDAAAAAAAGKTAVQPIAVDIAALPALQTAGTPATTDDPLLAAKSSAAIGPEVAASALEAQVGVAAGKAEQTVDGKAEASKSETGKPAAPGHFTIDGPAKGLEQALKALGQLPAQSAGLTSNPLAESAIQKAIASFEAKAARPEAAIKAVATDLKAVPTAFAANILLNTAPAGGAELPVQTNAQVAATQHPATLAALPVAIGSRALNGGREFTVHLYPAELGKVEVKLEISDKGDIKAKLTVDRVETLQLLQRDARSLHQALEQAGFKPSEDSVQFSLRQDNGQQASQRQQFSEGHGRHAAYVTPDAGDPQDQSRDVTAAVLAAYARRSNAALDIHV
ncbi:MAG: flagellar hook-length control protein FliK [Beijerinckiaceae bacterium]|nr:flagellar hook-length control protein FliK [Beijerinckiaceae bacterium]